MELRADPDVIAAELNYIAYAASGGGEPGGAGGGVSGGGMDPAVIGEVTIGLFAAAVLLLTGMRKKI